MQPEDAGTHLATMRKLAAGVGLLLLLSVAALIALHGRDIASLAAFGYPGVAILMFLSSSTVIFPAPGFAGVLAAGMIWNPVLVGVFAGVGSATGELSGYLLGMGGGAVLDLKESGRWRQLHRWVERNAFLAILALATVPNPLFDIMGLLAGSLSYPVRRFWVACAIGNSLKYVGLALLADSTAAWWLSR